MCNQRRSRLANAYPIGDGSFRNNFSTNAENYDGNFDTPSGQSSGSAVAVMPEQSREHYDQLMAERLTDIKPNTVLSTAHTPELSAEK